MRQCVALNASFLADRRGETMTPRWWRRREGAGITLSIAVAAAILALHYTTAVHSFGLHDLLRRLFYLPVITAAIAAGMRGGLLTAAVVAVGYIPHLRQLALAGDRTLDHVLELLLLPLVAALVGGFADSSRRARALAAERGRLAALGEVGLAVMAQSEGPVGAIEGQAESLRLLAQRSRDVAVRFAAERIQDETARVRRLLFDLRALGRPERRRASSVDLSQLATGIVADLAAGRATGSHVALGPVMPRVAVFADGRVVAHSLRALLVGLLESDPAPSELEIGLEGGPAEAVIRIRLSFASEGPPDLEHSLSAVFGADSRDYRFSQALCVQLLAMEGATVEFRHGSGREAEVAVRFKRGSPRRRAIPRSTRFPTDREVGVGVEGP